MLDCLKFPRGSVALTLGLTTKLWIVGILILISAPVTSLRAVDEEDVSAGADLIKRESFVLTNAHLVKIADEVSALLEYRLFLRSRDHRVQQKSVDVATLNFVQSIGEEQRLEKGLRKMLLTSLGLGMGLGIVCMFCTYRHDLSALSASTTLVLTILGALGGALGGTTVGILSGVAMRLASPGNDHSPLTEKSSYKQSDDFDPEVFWNRLATRIAIPNGVYGIREKWLTGLLADEMTLEWLKTLEPKEVFVRDVLENLLMQIREIDTRFIDPARSEILQNIHTKLATAQTIGRRGQRDLEDILQLVRYLRTTFSVNQWDLLATQNPKLREFLDLRISSILSRYMRGLFGLTLQIPIGFEPRSASAARFLSEFGGHLSGYISDPEVSQFLRDGGPEKLDFETSVTKEGDSTLAQKGDLLVWRIHVRIYRSDGKVFERDLHVSSNADTEKKLFEAFDWHGSARRQLFGDELVRPSPPCTNLISSVGSVLANQPVAGTTASSPSIVPGQQLER